MGALSGLQDASMPIACIPASDLLGRAQGHGVSFHGTQSPREISYSSVLTPLLPGQVLSSQHSRVQDSHRQSSEEAHSFIHFETWNSFPGQITHISLTNLKSMFSLSKTGDVGRETVRGGSVSMKWSNGVSPLTMWQECFLVSGSAIIGSLGCS